MSKLPPNKSLHWLSGVSYDSSIRNNRVIHSDASEPNRQEAD